MDYGPAWVPPWRAGLEQASCAGDDCSLLGARMCVKATMVRGLCVQCASKAGAFERCEPQVDGQLDLGL